MSETDPCPIDRDRSLAALRMECHALAMVIEQMKGEDMQRGTRLPGWSLQLLLAHLARGVDRISSYLVAPMPPDATVDWLSYYSHTPASDRTSVTSRAREFAESIDDRPVANVWDETWRLAVQEAEVEPAERIVHTPSGGIRLDHFLTTRVFEVTLHGLDLRHALGLEEVVSPFALEITAAVLDGILDGPRPDDLQDDDVEFVLAATGRRDHDDPSLPVVA